MLRSRLTLAAALLGSTLASAQQDASSQVLPATATKDAGTYHVATGTWTRNSASIAMIGSDILYDNTCAAVNFIGLGLGESFVDSGRLPSNTSGSFGSAPIYAIDGFELNYCSGEVSTDVRVNFYQCYTPCGDSTALIPEASITVTGLPGAGGGTGSTGCWVVTIDLAATTESFFLWSDCSGGFNGSPSLDNFGWSFEMLMPQVSGSQSGPMIAGDPLGILSGTACDYGDGTVWFGNGGNGTGLGTLDQFELTAGGAYNGCWFFGGYPAGNLYASGYLSVLGASVGPPPVGSLFCFTATSTTPCPCNNESTAGASGCANSFSTDGTALRAGGVASISNDSTILMALNMPPNQPGLYCRSLTELNGGNGVPFGDGLRCLGGDVMRLGVAFSSSVGFSSTISLPGGLLSGLNAGDVARFQLWYRDPIGSPCGSNFNLSNGVAVTVAP